jgi:hypothetical protein
MPMWSPYCLHEHHTKLLSPPRVPCRRQPPPATVSARRHPHEDRLGVPRFPDPSIGYSNHRTNPHSSVHLCSCAPPCVPLPPTNLQLRYHIHEVPIGVTNLFDHSNVSDDLVLDLLTVIPPLPRSTTVNCCFGEPPTSPTSPIQVPPLQCRSPSHSPTTSPPAWPETARPPPLSHHGRLPYFTGGLPAHGALA